MNAFTTDSALREIPWLLHGFGTRRFGEADLSALAAAHGLRPVLLGQIHSAAVLAVTDALPDGTPGDALITDTPGLLLVIKTADCLPLFLVDEERRAIAAVHAGWRGTAIGIAAAAVAALRERFDSRPGDLWAAMGPCIGPGCYEVGRDVAEPHPGRPEWGKALRPVAGSPDRFTLDLPAANRARLEAEGVPASRISAAGVCTHCSPDLLSWRRDRRTDARLYNFIGIRPKD
ncbi:MAG: peptidoglycan editing factor PgeF [Acidobacteriota bacterium]|nr:peptidoglycan editing factor PgeF [Acidobacteriota bacterium]